MIQIRSTDDRVPFSPSTPGLAYARPLQLILAEDDPDYARALVRRFSGSQSARYRVVCLSSLDALFARLEVRRPDAILLDLGLLDARGTSTLAYACSVARLVPIVVLTANADPALAALARRAGAYDYLIKSWHDFASIERTVLAAVRRGKRDWQG
jgi:DNA-binding response OmpR family regulator